MKLTYSGKPKEFTPELEQKIGAKLAKLSKFLEQRGEREAHVHHQTERHLHKVEIMVKFYDHDLVGEGADADLETALCNAVDKLEKRAVKVRNRWRDTQRDRKGVRSSKEGWENNNTQESETGRPVEVSGNGTGHTAKIFRVNYEEDRKPMTLEEALIEMEKVKDYFVYRDSDRDCLSVLVRREDGNFDLIES